MKKTYTSTDIHQKQGHELSKKLYRSISEQAKRLDDARSCARTIGDLFTPNLQVQRRKLCDYCEKLIFLEPTLYGRKGEELLWRKGYYDVVSTAKKLKKKEYTQDEISNIQAHIYAGIGFYHHFISRLQWEFNLNLNNIVDFENLTEEKAESGGSNNNSDGLEWANHALHQSLIYLGDLNRYKLEIYPNWEATLATRYYLQAISFKPEYGMPHNQMGTLAMNQNNFLGAVYYYMRCLACKFSFDGTTNNLHSLFEKNSKFIEELPDENENADCIIEPERSENIKRFLARFLLLIDIWYFNKKVSKVYNLCHQTYKDLEECLTYLKPTISENGDSPTDIESIETDSSLPSHLNSDMIFKIIVICLLTISKLRSTNSPQLSTVVAFTLAIYSQLIQHISNHIQECVQNYPLTDEIKSKQPNGVLRNLMKKTVSSKLRRRKKVVKVEDSEESDLSETENNVEYSSSDDSFMSDSENVLANSSDEELEGVKMSPASTENSEIKSELDIDQPELEAKIRKDVIHKVQRMDVNDMLEIITEETPLQSIKILNDWLKHDHEVLRSCGNNTRSLLRQITYLLNLININLNSSKLTGVPLKLSEIINKENKIPLSEDVVLKGFDLFSDVHSELDWNYMQKKSFTLKEEAVVRIVKLISFGKFLTTVQETGVSFEENKNQFVCTGKEEGDAKVPSAVVDEFNIQEQNGCVIGKSNFEDDKESDSKSQLMKMKHMGQLWLASEVTALESRVRGKPSLSPYLVLDADALIKYTFMVKHLVNSRKFIVLVPTAVVSALDDLKREKSEAREAIRWLEWQFQHGNRFFRLQRPNERAAIPLIKYPKKKDKEMHVYIQIIECCNYLAAQQKSGSNLVTLLIGNQNVLSNGENKEFSYVGLAQSAGIAIESITQFYGKWKKSKGKR